MKKLSINSSDIIHNLNIMRKECPKSRIIAVLKGNGYGLGAVQMAKLLIENGVDFFAVSGLSEAIELRDNGITADILLLSSTSVFEEAEKIAEYGITATVGSIASAEALAKTGKKCKAHIKAETGFGRYGFLSGADVPLFDNIEYEGVYSHFSDSFGKTEKHSREQFNKFVYFVGELKERGINPKIKHICNSCGALRFPYAHLDAIRTGSALLGRLPLPNTQGFKKVAVFESAITEIKTLPKGHNIGYANTFTTKRETKIAIVPGGYSDGIFTEKSRDTFRASDILRYIYNDLLCIDKKLTVEIGGKKVKVLGRVGMYNLILDITETDAQIGDKICINCNPILIDSSIKRVYNV